MTEGKPRSNPIALVALVGATATGKTSLGIELALRFNGEIVNADSRLFYRGMDVGTAKPTKEERRGVEHHMIDILDPLGFYSLSDFLRKSRSTISDIDNRGKTPIIAGGSGQYVWGLLEGWAVPEIPPNPELRRELEQMLRDEGIESLQRRLTVTRACNIDKVEILNPRRLVRAIERAIATGDAMGGAGKSNDPPYNALVIGLTAPREHLHTRVEKRNDEMLATGWIAEVKELINCGVTPDLPSMSAIGYRPIMDYLKGAITWETMREQILIGNRRLIGAQNNWFKVRDVRISWVDVTDRNYVDHATMMVSDWLLHIGETCSER